MQPTDTPTPEPGPDQSAGGAARPDDGTVRATGVAVLNEPDGYAETAVLLFTDAAPESIVMNWSDRGARGYRRMRRGALAHGVPESYTDDQRALRDPNALDISAHRPLSVTGGRPIFAAADVIVLVPPQVGDGLRELHVPVSSPEQPLVAVYAREHESSGPFRYTRTIQIDGAASCPVCGRLMRVGEVHGASHGVPGHLRAGGHGDEAREERSMHHARLDDPSVFRHTM